MNSITLIEKRLAAVKDNPDEKGVMQGNRSVDVLPKDLWKLKRKDNHLKGIGECSEKLLLWIESRKADYETVLFNLLNTEDWRKAKNMFLGMTYTILCNEGFYLLGKNNTPIGISYKWFCETFKLNRSTEKHQYYDFYNLNKKGKEYKDYNVAKFENVFFKLRKEICFNFLQT